MKPYRRQPPPPPPGGEGRGGGDGELRLQCKLCPEAGCERRLGRFRLSRNNLISQEMLTQGMALYDRETVLKMQGYMGQCTMFPGCIPYHPHAWLSMIAAALQKGGGGGGEGAWTHVPADWKERQPSGRPLP